VISIAFDFYQKQVDEDGEVDEKAVSRYAEELEQLFAESPEGRALAERGVEPGRYLGLFLDYGMRYTGKSLAEMDASDIREALDVMAQKTTARPEDLDEAIPELEAFCDFVGREFGLKRSAEWKREIQDDAREFRRWVRDSQHWGMAKSMMMEGLARGYDLSTEEDINRWLLTKQAEQLAAIEAGKGIKPDQSATPLGERLRRILSAGAPPSPTQPDDRPLIIADVGGPGSGDLFGAGRPTGKTRSQAQKGKSRRKQARASKRRNRR